MSIFLNKDSRVIVQGITGGEGSKHTALMLKAGTNVVGGVNARKAGTTVEHGDVTLPVFGTVAEAMTENTYAQFVQAASQSSHLDLATRSTNPSGATFMSDTNSEITQVSIRIADKRFMDYMGYSPSVNMVIVSSVTQKR